ncbi:MAG: hypothetical protein QOJ09_865, partial [Actinomycetota bacterium]|nr:hypothetical protein [Actinomycetota bacterium]
MAGLIGLMAAVAMPAARGTEA